MKQILTSATPLIRQLPIRPHNTIANGTLTLTLQRAVDIAPKRSQRINQTTVENRYGTKTDTEPRLPFSFVDSDAVEAFNVRVCERKGGGE
jgi:hypothetical protein